MKIRTAFLVILGVVLSGKSNADLVLSLSSDNGINFANNFDVQVGDSLDLGIYLQQTSPDTVLVDQGLVSWGLDVTRTPTGLGAISNVAANPSFDFQNHNVLTMSGFELEYAQTLGTGVTGDSILLGSFQFDATGAGTTQFTIADRIIGSGPANSSWITPAFNELDEQIFGAGAADTFQFSVTSTSAVPEPRSFVLLGCIAGFIVLRRRLGGKGKLHQSEPEEVGVGRTK